MAHCENLRLCGDRAWAGTAGGKNDRAGGGLAPTIETLLDEGRFQTQHRTALHHFFDALEKHHICMADLHIGNIVYVGDDKTTGRFVSVDGLGTRTLVPLRDCFRSFNARRTRRRASQVWRQIDQHHLKLQSEASKTAAPPAVSDAGNQYQGAHAL